MEGDAFADLATQKIMHRDFGNPTFSVKDNMLDVEVTTADRVFHVDKETLLVSVKLEGYWVDSHQVHPLGGTFRTLDNGLGDRILFGENKEPVKLSDSIFSLEGVAEIDDSASYLLEENGTLSARRSGDVDRYILAFGKDYLGGLREFYGLTGFTPLLPKYALGNWWSHDIGGHMGSKGNPELYTRWVQLGVFSPINRLHSTRDKWSKEPWLYGAEAEKIVTKFLQLRHRLLPYLYTANVRTAREGLPIVMPMYYLHDCKEAYEAKTQYYFGTEMIVAPVVTRKNKEGLVSVSVWLPEGKWTDFFTGQVIGASDTVYHVHGNMEYSIQI